MQIHVYRLLGKQIYPNERHKGLCGLDDSCVTVTTKPHKLVKLTLTCYLRFSCIEIVTTRI